MGLDISYYRTVTRRGDYPESGDYDYDALVHIYPNPHFVAQADGLTDGLYSFTDAGGFRAGSYGGYNDWRRRLADLAGYSDEEAFAGAAPAESAFLPLVNFSDCEGVIGADTSKRLAADFARFADAVADNGWFAELYRAWRIAFETAADGGAVLFH